MAGCMLLGQHVITIEYGTESFDYPEETNMVIKTGDIQVQFYIAIDGSLNATYSTDLTMGAELFRVLPPPKPTYAVYRWFGDCECCASDDRVSQAFDHIVDAFAFASKFAKEQYDAEVDMVAARQHYELDTDKWSGYVALEVRRYEYDGG